MRKQLYFIGVSFCIGLCVVFCYSDLFSEKAITLAPKDIEPVKIETVELADLLALLKHEDAVLVDIRSRDIYMWGSIPAAINIPYSDGNGIDAIKNKLKKTSTVVLFGNHNDYRHILETAQKIYKSGFSDVKIYERGWEEWKACDLPIKKDGEGNE